ncbi:MAG: hypothetical protein HYY50_04555 [Candidatus Kerfeldbacteria bacterium]|nr:hypothetical protein [Candidatus Kerfeldbacteria bacterium]
MNVTTRKALLLLAVVGYLAVVVTVIFRLSFTFYTYGWQTRTFTMDVGDKAAGPVIVQVLPYGNPFVSHGAYGDFGDRISWLGFGGNLMFWGLLLVGLPSLVILRRRRKKGSTLSSST